MKEQPERQTQMAPVGLAVAFIIFLAVIGGLALRLLYIFSLKGEMASDEAVFGLMAIHIAEGISYPIYCWGAHYAGAVISYMAAPLIALYGPTAIPLKAATLPFVAGAIAAAGLWGARLRGRAGAFAAAALIAVPLPLFMLYSVAAIGGYTETFFLGTLLWLFTIRLAEKSSPSRIEWILAGFTAGFGLYIVWLILPMICASIAVLFFDERSRAKNRKGFLWAALGFLVGLLPMIIYNIRFPLASFRRAAGRSVGDTALLHPGTFLHEVRQGLDHLFSAWGGWSIALLLLVFVALCAWKRRHLAAGRLVLWFLPAWILFCAAGGLTRGRQWTLFYLVLVLAIPLLRKRSALWIASFLLAVNLVSAFDFIRQMPVHWSQERTDRIVEELQRRDIDRVLTGYETAYRLMYATGLNIVASPLAGPVKTDRYPPYSDEVLSAGRWALILPAGAYSESWVSMTGSESKGMTCASGLCIFEPEMSPHNALEVLP